MPAGSIGVAVWIARIAFVILVVQALIDGKVRVALAAAGLGLTGWVAVPWLNPYLVTPYLAIVDIGLVFAVFGRDIRLN
jgi:hypothetical protein